MKRQTMIMSELKEVWPSLQKSTGRKNHEVTDSQSRECGKVPEKGMMVACFEMNNDDM